MEARALSWGSKALSHQLSNYSNIISTKSIIVFTRDSLGRPVLLFMMGGVGGRTSFATFTRRIYRVERDLQHVEPRVPLLGLFFHDIFTFSRVLSLVLDSSTLFQIPLRILQRLPQASYFLDVLMLVSSIYPPHRISPLKELSCFSQFIPHQIRFRKLLIVLDQLRMQLLPLYHRQRLADELLHPWATQLRSLTQKMVDLEQPFSPLIRRIPLGGSR